MAPILSKKEINAINESELTPLVCCSNDNDIAEKLVEALLLNEEIDVNAQTGVLEDTALMTAVKLQRNSIVQLLQKKQGNMHQANPILLSTSNPDFGFGFEIKGEKTEPRVKKSR